MPNKINPNYNPPDADTPAPEVAFIVTVLLVVVLLGVLALAARGVWSLL